MYFEYWIRTDFKSYILGNDELVKSLIFDAVVTNDFENQKSPRRGGNDMV